LVGPVYALLLTPDGRAWEAYQGRAQDLPPALLHSPAGLLRSASREDGAIAVLDGTPFLVAARPVTDPSGRVRATLVVALNEQELAQGNNQLNLTIGIDAESSPLPLLAIGIVGMGVIAIAATFLLYRRRPPAEPPEAPAPEPVEAIVIDDTAWRR